MTAVAIVKTRRWGGATTARGGDASLAAGRGGGGNAACPTAGDEMNRRANKIAVMTEG